MIELKTIVSVAMMFLRREAAVIVVTFSGLASSDSGALEAPMHAD